MTGPLPPAAPMPSPTDAAGLARVPLDATRLSRMRWRCRRGMLENDIVLTRFLEARGDALDEADARALDTLLDLTDGELWDVIAGRTELADATLAPMVAALRAA